MKCSILYVLLIVDKKFKLFKIKREESLIFKLYVYIYLILFFLNLCYDCIYF